MNDFSVPANLALHGKGTFIPTIETFSKFKRKLTALNFGLWESAKKKDLIIDITCSFCLTFSE